jgi:hypothetical protein
MPFYEIVYETGNVSVAEYADDAEALAAAGAQDQRAREGGAAGPQGGPAERVAKLYKYDQHPNEYNPDQTASAEVVEKEISELIKATKDKNGVVNIDQLALEVRGLSHPMTSKEHAHDSQFKMKEKGVLTLEGGGK